MVRKKIAQRLASGCLLVAAIGVCASACKREEPKPSSAAAIDLTTARKSIAEARCDLEQRCNKIGPGKLNNDRAECLGKIEENWWGDLDGKDCQHGVNQSELSECLTELRNHECDKIFDNLGNAAACRSSDLCKTL